MSDSIPDSTNEHQGSSTKGVPLPRPRKVLVDENDLWNLDDDLTDSAAPPAEELRPTVQTGIPQKHSSDHITRIEPNQHSFFTNTSQLDPLESGAHESPQMETKNGFVPVQESATETPAESTRMSQPYGPVEDDIWSEFEDDNQEKTDLPQEEALPHQFVPLDTESAHPPSVEAEVVDFPETPDADESLPSITPVPIEIEPLPEPTVADYEPAIHVADSDETEQQHVDLLPHDEHKEEQTELDEHEHEHEHHAPVDWRALAGPSWLSITKFELTAIISSFVILAILAVAGLIIFRTDIRTQDNPFLRASMPAKGEIATIEAYETYWRKPQREGPNADSARLDIISIPEVKITLSESTATAGVIRVVFYNDVGEMAGDTLTYRFQQGKFVDNSQKSIAFTATAGFRSFGEQEAYRARQTLPWTIRVYEGADENAPSSSFRLLFSSAISTNRQ